MDRNLKRVEKICESCWNEVRETGLTRGLDRKGGGLSMKAGVVRIVCVIGACSCPGLVLVQPGCDNRCSLAYCIIR